MITPGTSALVQRELSSELGRVSMPISSRFGDLGMWRPVNLNDPTGHQRSEVSQPPELESK
jgi:hypothetical protein